LQTSLEDIVRTCLNKTEKAGRNEKREKGMEDVHLFKCNLQITREKVLKEYI
jgi:hypothetical protein